MEKLKSTIPTSLKKTISQSTIEDLPSICSSLLDFFLSLNLFHTVVKQLSDPATALCRKNVNAAMELKKKGNECFSNGDYEKALRFYSKGLRVAPMSDGDDDDENKLVVTLYTNRASALHKLSLVVECIRDCDRAIILSPCYAKAWYRRGKACASLEHHEDAIHDLNVAMSMELSLGGKNRIKDELTVLNRAQRTNGILYKIEDKNLGFFVESHISNQIKLQCISTPAKGRGMTSLTDIPQGTLIHAEEPYATVVLKQCRETHCHFCLNILPADTVPCSSCTIPLYCSQSCEVKGGGQRYWNKKKNSCINVSLSTDIEEYITSVTRSPSSFGSSVADCNLKDVPEHRHECGGAHWAAVLPSEIVLAGRIIAKLIEQKQYVVKPSKTLDLCQNYARMSPESKLEAHIYSCVLTYCLQRLYGSVFPLNGVSVSQLVVLVSQIKVNSIAVVRIKSNETDALQQSGKLSASDDFHTNSIEQVRVGQAIYTNGSMFNHSCQPNINAYFLSRCLFIQSTEFVPAGYPLEISYGPQVGQWDINKRQSLLEEQYSFNCQCTGCSEINLSDLVISAFSCPIAKCSGVILDSHNLRHGEYKNGSSRDVPIKCLLERPLPDDKRQRDDIIKVAYMLLHPNNDTCQLCLGRCLNCCSSCDLESSRIRFMKSQRCIKRLTDAVFSKELPIDVLTNAMDALNVLKSVLHAYNKNIALVEDNLAEAFCLIGDFRNAMQHCKASIEILEKLYHAKHIVIANELVKLSSIQLSLGDRDSAVKSINRLEGIFSLYYGSHTGKLVPFVDILKRAAALPA